MVGGPEATASVRSAIGRNGYLKEAQQTQSLMKLRVIYFVLFVFCVWLALATRSHRDWFPPLVVKYGGDVI